MLGVTVGYVSSAKCFGADVSTFRLKNEDGTLVPFDSSRFKQSVRNAVDCYDSQGDAPVSVSELTDQTIEALLQELGGSGTIEAHDIRTQIEMSLVLSSSNGEVEID